MNEPISKNQDYINEHLHGTEYEGTPASLYHKNPNTDEKGDGSRQYVSNGVLILDEIVRKDDGVSSQVILRIVPFVCGKRYPAFDIPNLDLDNVRKHAPTAFRPGNTRGASSMVTDCIRNQAVFRGETSSYTHTGIREIDGEYVYIFSGGAITENGIDDSIKSDFDEKLKQYSFTDADDPERWETFRKFLEVAPHTVMYPLLSLAALCPLNESLRQSGIEPAFVMVLLGVTGTMKSTLAALTMAFYGESFNNKSLPSSVNDTVNALEEWGFVRKDALTVIDDIFPANTKEDAAHISKLAQKIARMYGDRTGKSRMYSDGTKRPEHPVRGNALMTGEMMPNLGESGEARFLRVGLQHGDVNTEVLTEVQAKTEHLNQCMRDYIQWLLCGYGERKSTLKASFIALRSEAQTGGHGRTAEAIAHLQLAMGCWTQFLCEKGIISAADRKTMLSENWSILMDISREQKRAIDEEKPTRRFREALSNLLTTGKAKVLPRYGEPSTVCFGEMIGWEDESEGNYYLIPQATFRVVNKYYSEQGITFGLNQGALQTHLINEGIIIKRTSKNGKDDYYPNLTIGRKQHRVWIMPMSMLNPPEDSTEDSTV